VLVTSATLPKKINDKPPTNRGMPFVEFEAAVHASVAHGSGGTAVLSPKQGASLRVATTAITAPITRIPAPTS
jgi:hypothetical protein